MRPKMINPKLLMSRKSASGTEFWRGKIPNRARNTLLTANRKVCSLISNERHTWKTGILLASWVRLMWFLQMGWDLTLHWGSSPTKTIRSFALLATSTMQTKCETLVRKGWESRVAGVHVLPDTCRCRCLKFHRSEAENLGRSWGVQDSLLRVLHVLHQLFNFI